MAAFRLAAQLGAQGIEIDLQVSRDGHIIALHDASLERTTNGRGLVSDFTFAELRALDAGSWFSPAFAGEKITALDEILAFARETGLHLYLEMKYQDAPAAHTAVLQAMRSSGVAERCVMLSFNSLVLESLRQRDVAVRTGFLFERPLPGIEIAQRIGASQLAPRFDLVSRKLVSQAHDAGLAVVTWTVNEPDAMRAAMAAGVDGIMSDFPDRLQGVLAERGS
jgi:glycerophosphoryl diester phosphodiesterase